MVCREEAFSQQARCGEPRRSSEPTLPVDTEKPLQCNASEKELNRNGSHPANGSHLLAALLTTLGAFSSAWDFRPVQPVVTGIENKTN
eukprot:2371764-Pyramimonas_sp.AAC.1